MAARLTTRCRGTYKRGKTSGANDKPSLAAEAIAILLFADTTPLISMNRFPVLPGGRPSKLRTFGAVLDRSLRLQSLSCSILRTGTGRFASNGRNSADSSRLARSVTGKIGISVERTGSIIQAPGVTTGGLHFSAVLPVVDPFPRRRRSSVVHGDRSNCCSPPDTSPTFARLAAW